MCLLLSVYRLAMSRCSPLSSVSINGFAIVEAAVALRDSAINVTSAHANVTLASRWPSAENGSSTHALPIASSAVDGVNQTRNATNNNASDFERRWATTRTARHATIDAWRTQPAERIAAALPECWRLSPNVTYALLRYRDAQLLHASDPLGAFPYHYFVVHAGGINGGYADRLKVRGSSPC